jgi:MYXO-CTERM domain-containing protein
LPATIPASTTQNFVFSVQSTAQCTNGQISVRASGQDGNANPLLGEPSGTFTLSGGVPPAPTLVFAAVQASGLLNPGGSLVVTATIRNDGTAGGDFSNTPPITFTFTQGASDVSAKFGGPTAPSKPLPLSIAPAATTTVSWTFTIATDTPFGGTQVAIGGGGPDNPATPGTVSFNIVGKSSTNPSSGSSGCAPVGPMPPILPVALVALLAAAGGRRRKD